MASRSSDHDKQMAKYLKDRGITRTSKRCPGCHNVVPIGMDVSVHMRTCGGSYSTRRR